MTENGEEKKEKRIRERERGNAVRLLLADKKQIHVGEPMSWFLVLDINMKDRDGRTRT